MSANQDLVNAENGDFGTGGEFWGGALLYMFQVVGRYDSIPPTEERTLVGPGVWMVLNDRTQQFLLRDTENGGQESMKQLAAKLGTMNGRKFDKNSMDDVLCLLIQCAGGYTQAVPFCQGLQPCPQLTTDQEAQLKDLRKRVFLFNIANKGKFSMNPNGEDDGVQSTDGFVPKGTSNSLDVFVLAVGAGSCTFVGFPTGPADRSSKTPTPLRRTMLIDCGSTRKKDYGRDDPLDPITFLLNWFESHRPMGQSSKDKGTIDLLVLTHPRPEFNNMLDDVLKAGIKISNFIYSCDGDHYGSSLYSRLKAKKAVPYMIPLDQRFPWKLPSDILPGLPPVVEAHVLAVNASTPPYKAKTSGTGFEALPLTDQQMDGNAMVLCITVNPTTQDEKPRRVLVYNGANAVAGAAVAKSSSQYLLNVELVVAQQSAGFDNGMKVTPAAMYGTLFAETVNPTNTPSVDFIKTFGTIVAKPTADTPEAKQTKLSRIIALNDSQLNLASKTSLDAQIAELAGAQTKKLVELATALKANPFKLSTDFESAKAALVQFANQLNTKVDSVKKSSSIDSRTSEQLETFIGGLPALVTTVVTSLHTMVPVLQGSGAAAAGTWSSVIADMNVIAAKADEAGETTSALVSGSKKSIGLLTAPIHKNLETCRTKLSAVSTSDIRSVEKAAADIGAAVSLAQSTLSTPQLPKDPADQKRNNALKALDSCYKLCDNIVRDKSGLLAKVRTDLGETQNALGQFLDSVFAASGEMTSTITGAFKTGSSQDPTVVGKKAAPSAIDKAAAQREAERLRSLWVEYTPENAIFSTLPAIGVINKAAQKNQPYDQGVAYRFEFAPLVQPKPSSGAAPPAPQVPIVAMQSLPSLAAVEKLRAARKKTDKLPSFPDTI